VEACEDDPETAFAVNCHAVRNLAVVCQSLGARLVHISTDYVFSGSRRAPYPEDAPPDPLNVYGVSKVAGEHFVRSGCEDHAIVRVSGLFGLVGASGKGGNFVETMLRLGHERGQVTVVTDQVLSPTYTGDAEEKIAELTNAGARGTFHVTNSGSCSWFDVAEAVFRASGMDVPVHPTTSAAMPSAVRRPSYSVLANERLRTEGFGELRHWKDALTEYLAARASRRERVTA
jgi:dTDP-4-dehydrorhamnose reductase